ncbi:penicillin-binding protein 1A [Rickettsiales endosymbiont of Peranema trichophorum]|uniref:penicillin-binding protein 1A n=1 Tax=Rickettsiales endosymbiont of Peranema trichophorum TaxID=2486577 RepID=UPI0010235093|nr:penicillin-binding protein 1A [Rickettsiales endosymbiont of Peranema trichophorum]RZI47426.1 penicillin-binding protein 1A [Rickettsiales endosymbiont of Peranema trichophorum]
MFQKVKKIARFWFCFFTVLFVITLFTTLQVLYHYSKDLPDYKHLEEYDPPTVTRLYTLDGKILDEFAVENRIYTKYSDIPPMLVKAFIAAEDQNFLKHEGIDIQGIIRACLINILNVGKQKNPAGGSTITQQVVKNFLLSNERTISRKIKEAILAYRISRIYSKERILELYLNQIYMGNHSYGIASAALNYFNKKLSDLTLDEVAVLAAIPKSPSTINPIKGYARTVARRNWVLQRMYDEQYITQEEYEKAKQLPITLKERHTVSFFKADYYSETVRQELIERFGEDAVYQDGLQVYTNVDEKLQSLATRTLQEGLLQYDKKHGWRGPLGRIDLPKNPDTDKSWVEALLRFSTPPDIEPFQVGVALKVTDNAAKIAVVQDNNNVSYGSIKLSTLSWARKNLNDQTLGKTVSSVREVIKIGDVIAVRATSQPDEFLLEQIPDVNGALVVLETVSGKVLAEVGGYSFKKSRFNRVTQARRQPGSAFKSFVYLAALEQGIPPNTILEDSPIEIEQGYGLPIWKPKNIDNKYLGPITFRQALERSRNLPTIRLLLTLGLEPVTELAERLGIYTDAALKRSTYSIALGAFETTVLNIANAYNIIASGGKRVQPHFIDRVYDRRGNLIYSTKTKNVKYLEDETLQTPPLLADAYDQVIEPEVNYQLLSILQGAVLRGTGARARALNMPIAGKTGTTNDSCDSWFIGFNPNILVAVYVGFDVPRTLGQKESGATLALPIFVNFMQNASKHFDKREFDIPNGVTFVNVDYNTGELVQDENHTGRHVRDVFVQKAPTDDTINQIFDTVLE